MSTQSSPSGNVGLTVDIVSAYVTKNSVPLAELPALIANVHSALNHAAKGAMEQPQEKLQPAVPIKKSITPNFIVCLEDGEKFKSLKRHLRTSHNLAPDQYRAKWRLPSDYPVVSRNYAKQRSELATKMGLGQAGLEVRVAVIRTKYDLGSVPVLYRQPRQYATFLGQELYYWYKDNLLIVMPNGFGIYKNGPAPAADKAVVEALPPPGTTSGNALVSAATQAVKALAARRGIDLSDARPSERSSTARDRIALSIGTAVAVGLAAGFVFIRRRRAHLG